MNEYKVLFEEYKSLCIKLKSMTMCTREYSETTEKILFINLQLETIERGMKISSGDSWMQSVHVMD